MSIILLHHYLQKSATRHPERVAVVDPTAGRTITYAELDDLACRVCRFLLETGIEPGDRVGLVLRKSIDTVAAIFGILRAGAAYVPVSPSAPMSRNAFVFQNCGVKRIFSEATFESELSSRLGEFETSISALDFETESLPLAAYLEEFASPELQIMVEPRNLSDEQLAYILYTSGSTGKPKGVMLSHRNATSYVEWCSEVFEPNESDRFSSHAPFHFDLSILDLYLSIKHGSTVVLIGESLGKNPAAMVDLIAEQQLTVWYSTPSVLTLILEHGKLEGRKDIDLRLVFFAGEVFPVKHLRRLMSTLPDPRYFNLYGPTETNVCTFHEIDGPVPEDRTQPYPIGRVCSHLRSRVVDEQGRDIAPGETGELVIAGPSVLQGYWQLPELTDSVFLEQAGMRWYRTGDVVIEEEGGVYTFVGRRDRMVKRRGFRIELGEIEAALYQHPGISEVAVVAISTDEGVTIDACYSTSSTEPLSVIALKRFSSENLPGYMVPDRFVHLADLPKTSTDKIDYQRLKGAEV